MPSKPTEPKTTRNKFVLNNLLAKRRKPKSGLLDSATSLAQEQIDRTHSFADFVADELSKKPDAEKQAELAKLSAPVGQLIRALMVKGKRLARNPNTKKVVKTLPNAVAAAAVPGVYEYASHGGISGPLAEWITGSDILNLPSNGRSLRMFDAYPALQNVPVDDPVNGTVVYKPTMTRQPTYSEIANPAFARGLGAHFDSTHRDYLGGTMAATVPLVFTPKTLGRARWKFNRSGGDLGDTAMALGPAFKNKILFGGAVGVGYLTREAYNTLNNIRRASGAFADAADEVRSNTGDIMRGSAQAAQNAADTFDAFKKMAPEIGGAASGIRDMSKQIGEASSEMSGAIKPLGEAATAARPALEQMGPALNALAETPDQLSRGLTTASGDIRSGLESATNTIGSNLAKFENTLKYLGFGALGVGGTYLVLKKLLEYKAAKDREVTRRAALARPQTKSKKVTIDPGDYLIDVKDPTPA